MTVESTEQSDQLKQSLKEEKQTRKRLESKVEHIEEELNDLRHEKESLERVRALSGSRQNFYGGMCLYTFRAISFNCRKVSGFEFATQLSSKIRANFSSNQT